MLSMKKLFLFCLFTEWTKFGIAVKGEDPDQSVHDTSNISPLIVGGEDAKPYDYPYYSFIFNKYFSGGCGAALIAPDMILTDSRCIIDMSPYNQTVVVGIYYVTTSDGPVQTYTRVCKETYIHPQINSAGFELDYNVALCKLNETVVIDESVIYLELNDDDSVPPIDETTTVIGMGANNSKPLPYPDFERLWTFPDVLQTASTTVISNRRCNDMLNDLLDALGFPVRDVIPEVSMCAWDQTLESGVCDYDTGSLLLTVSEQDDGRILHTLVGIAMSPINDTDCLAGPTIYSRVSSSMDWIKEVVCNDLGSVARFCMPTSTFTPTTLLSTSTATKEKPTSTSAPTSTVTKAQMKTPKKIYKAKKSGKGSKKKAKKSSKGLKKR
mmetsp:Transcript_37038/g.72820  ORF Transcript_37038/g.72820 Transcript_37038/m.72820 type:complete len:382 (+) Transcript_37038:107-1252(+)